MKKLTREEQARVMGGYDEQECHRVQELAAYYFRLEMEGFQINPEWWDDWADEFDLYCM